MGESYFGVREPFLAAVTRPTVTVEPPMDADVSALQDALSRIRALLLTLVRCQS
ncbi:MAG: hypothetical protein CM15mP74_33210 [Halieaceae bacterium]|nr:MAG: hypothetical protein CM15mP74_33210 [Halieaceae bacterium]